VSRVVSVEQGEHLARDPDSLVFPPLRRSARSRARRVAKRVNELIAELARRREAGQPHGVEWVLDNHFVLRRAIRQVRRGFNREFERLLPSNGAGLRRVEVEAFVILREGEGLLDRELLIRRADAFGRDHDASLAELWALPMLLRLGALEQIARDLPRLDASSSDAKIDHRVSNCVRSLVLLEKANWPRFIERISEVQRILAGDPAGVHSRMDFESRDRYRRTVERLARGSELSETHVAARAVELASLGDPQQPQGHVGYYLRDAGRKQLERTIRYEPRTRERVVRALRRQAEAIYIGSIAVIAALHLVVLAAVLAAAATPAGLVAVACVLALIPAWTIAISLTNWVITLLLRPRSLAKLEFDGGVPAEHRTLIVVPGLLTSRADADALARRLEAHWLATRESNVEVAMLTDLRDCASEIADDDEELVEHARARVIELNERHGEAGERPFHLFHRKRVWCPRQGCWMGWERKRGKLDELNRLLRDDTNTSYVVHEGREGHFAEFRYVLTLDADTVLPLDAARRLIETLAHPLNRARFDADGRVRSGYTVLQPRIDLAPIRAATRFARAFAGEGAFDIYSRAVSDVYQDLFGEGTFVGKGIYAIDDFQRSVASWMPHDRILSHDLLEGVLGRAGLVTDVVLYEDYPRTWLAFARRLHRWVRGDWQLLPWLGRRVPVPAPEGRRELRRRNPLGLLARYKIVDNLRRSLLAPSLVGFASFAWLTLPGPAGGWTALVAIVLGTPLLTEFGSNLLHGIRPGELRPAISNMLAALPTAIGRWLLHVAMLLHEARVCLDAMIRAIVRTSITRRNQLEWTPAASTGRGTDDPRTIVGAMVGSLLLPPAIVALLAWLRPSAWLGALPLSLAWFLSPWLAVWTARTGRPRRLDPPLDRTPLRRLARRTWSYFETVIGPADHWLPPDNLQEQPVREVAHRTSPTNIAMSLLTTLAAHDLGYLDLLELVFRLRSSIETIGRLPRHRGHVLNWIATTTLEPLEPRYVSTVDSGNLAAALLVLEQTCRELAVEARPIRGRFVGLADSFEVLGEALEGWGARAEPAARQIAAMRDRVLGATDDPLTWPAIVETLDDGAFAELDARLLQLFQTRTGDEAEPARFEDLQTWATRTRAEVFALYGEMGAQLPWLELLVRPPDPIPEDQRDAFALLLSELRLVPTLGQTDEVLGRALERVEAMRSASIDVPTSAWRDWVDRVAEALTTGREQAELLRTRLDEIAGLAAGLVAAMDFAFLYDPERELAYIGYDVTAERYDDHHYDLLASEARLASLLGIAKGDMPLRHWTKLGRPIGRFGGSRGLLSWSGTMFEYLMPPLLIDEGRGTLLDISARAAIRAQIAWARRLGLPWGMSESAYARRDNHRTYQYRAFGVPATGFRRGLERDLVVAPYASLLALVHEPTAVASNLVALKAAGALGPLGAYEALDYTRERVGFDCTHEVVRAYMSHHQGMVMLALHGYLCGRKTVRRMHRNSAVRAVELLLHERSPGPVPVERPQPAAEGPPIRARPDVAHGWLSMPNSGVDVHAVSNGRYGLLISRAGAGHSWWKQIAITRPCQDPTLEDVGSVIYVRDDDDGRTWCSLGELNDPGHEVMFVPHGAIITVHRHDLVGELTITVAPTEDAELRVVRLSERAGRSRRLTLTHYAEIVLGSAVEYERHPAFAKLFVDSQLVVFPRPAILCRRRPRVPDQPERWLACALVSDSVVWSAWETDRERFVGRRRSLRDPAGRVRWLPTADTPLLATLDTCVVMSGDVELGPGETCECAFVIAYGSSRTEALERLSRLATMAAVRRNVLDADRVAVARARARGHDTAALQGHQRLLSTVLYPRPELLARREILAGNRLGQPALWRHGISGDWPIVLARVNTVGSGVILRLADAHAHWFERGLAIDLVFLEDRSSSYDGSLRHRLAQLLEHAGARLSQPGGGVFVIHGASLDSAERNLLLGCASVVLEPDLDLDELLAPLGSPALPPFEPEGQPPPPSLPLPRPDDLQFDNGYGGFSADGREYVVQLEPERPTPAPWVNVLANPDFGCLVSERGIVYAWSVNAGLHRLTPWSNDAVLDPPSISLYLRDELDGVVWSPLPAPAPDDAPYQVRHAAGRSTFVHHGHALRQRTEVFVAPHDPVAVVRLALANEWDRPRRLTVTLCVEWLLGSRRADARTLFLDFVPEHEVVLATNAWNPTFAERCAFVTTSEHLHGITSNREEFFGRSGERSSPAALGRIGLSGGIVHGSDPCTVLQVHVVLAPGAATELHFAFGETGDRASALALAERYRDPASVDRARDELELMWDRLLSAVEVTSPEPGFDLMVNRWLLYQAIASRLWGRTGFSQSSGAFGFRDQLQDVMALIHVAPERTRAHLLDAAGQQFTEGDVLHWWHPPQGEGLRSRCSDDLLWLPFVTAHYVRATGDESVLHEQVRWLDAPPLGPDEHERYCNDLAVRGSATLYEHCMQALAHASGVGPDGLPLIGSSDWNDGFSHVGLRGRGESVWMGWFVRTTALAFADVCERLGHAEDARELHERAAALVEPLADAWDGAWYLRAIHDDGTPIGSSTSDACRIDSLAQSWAALVPDPTPTERERVRRAMDAVWQQLVMLDERLVRLFVPAFERAQARVGYVEGYPPGVRENAGQYTHAAVWVAWAFAELGELERAWTIARMINPLAHGSDGESIERYRVEPYVVAADVYTEPPHIGRGGWTWYTGTAAWSWRLAVERLLGVQRVEGRVHLAPTLPSSWPGCRLVLRDAATVVRVQILRRGPGNQVVRCTFDGIELPIPIVLPRPDGREHEVEVTLDEA
jgi:cyclic beta-1,2-glucan synthetase